LDIMKESDIPQGVIEGEAGRQAERPPKHRLSVTTYDYHLRIIIIPNIFPPSQFRCL
jgi:hypothetical protein